MLQRTPTSKTADTAGHCHTHGLLPYRDETPQAETQQTPLLWGTQHPLLELPHS